MFESSVIDEYVSLSCPQCEKIDLKINQDLKILGKTLELFVHFM